MDKNQFQGIPGAELIQQGLMDLRSGTLSENALLVLIASPRLESLGIVIPKIPPTFQSCEHELYTRLEQRLGPGAHSQYNSLIRRVVSFARALN